MKKIFGLLMILVVGSITQASDNRSAPNVFSSGSTISSSQMNENFNFLASEIREKDVNCNNGETITDAINEGYNSLTIYGTCDGGFMVYMLDPTPFNINISQMLNKPITHLIIKGGDSNRASIIQKTSDGMNSNVMTKGYLQLYNLTFNDKLNVNDGSVLYLNEVDFESLNLDNDDYSQINIYGNSNAIIRDSNITGELRASENSNIEIKKSTLSPSSNSNYSLEAKKNSHIESEELTLSGEINVNRGSSWSDDNSVINAGSIYISQNSSVEIYDSTINCDDPDSDCITVRESSNMQINQSTLNGSNIDQNWEGIIVWGSYLRLNNFTSNASISLHHNASMEAADINLSCVSGNYGCLNLSYNSSAWIFGNSSLNSIDNFGITLETGSTADLELLITRNDNQEGIFLTQMSMVNIKGNANFVKVSCGAGDPMLFDGSTSNSPQGGVCIR